jgi:hypothetical protein
MGVASFQGVQPENLLTNLSLRRLGIFFMIVLEYRITGVSDFIHRPDFNNYKKKELTRRFGNLICFRPQVRGDTCCVGSLRTS